MEKHNSVLHVHLWPKPLLQHLLKHRVTCLFGNDRATEINTCGDLFNMPESNDLATYLLAYSAMR